MKFRRNLKKIKFGPVGAYGAAFAASRAPASPRQPPQNSDLGDPSKAL